MEKTVQYQGYTIQSSPQYETDWEKWRLRIFISVEDHRGIRSREFSSEVLYRTEQEADIHGITFGQRVIDGKVEGRSVADYEDDGSTSDATPPCAIPHHVFGSHQAGGDRHHARCVDGWMSY